MRLFGRMSIYGEYLTGVAPGLVAMSDLHLATDEHNDISGCKAYDPQKDTVAELLKGLGFATETKFRGNLPLGYGFAGSTILGFLHLRNQLSVEKATQIVTECDELIHGFRPSGLDSMACLHQRSGFYCRGQWTDIDVPRFEYTLVLFPKLISRPLVEIKATVASHARFLVPLADHLTNRIMGAAELDYDVLLEYCRVLVNLGVYSPVASAVIKSCLDQKVVAKGIGGLHDKALLVIWPQNPLRAKGVAEALQSFRPSSVFSGIR